MLSTSDFSKLYAKEYGVSLESATVACSNVWKLLGKVLYTLGEDFNIHKIGTLKKQRVSPKRFKHPLTGKLSVRIEKYVIKFKESEFPYT